MVDAGDPITVDDFSAELDDHEARLDTAEASIAALAASVIAYMGDLSLCKQTGQTIDTVNGSGRISITFNATMPSLPDVNVSLGDYTGTYVVGVIAASVTTTGCDVWVFYPDGTAAVGDSVRVVWSASCPFPDTGGISG